MRHFLPTYTLVLVSALLFLQIGSAAQSALGRTLRLTHESGHYHFIANDTTEPDSLYLYRRGMYWYGTHTRYGIDTLRLYVERHPFATKAPGEVIDALGETVGMVSDLHQVKTDDFIEEYNWLAKVQPLNSEMSYQTEVIGDLASAMWRFDRNGAANLWYNYSLLFPDSTDVKIAYGNIKSIRDDQKLRWEDTTAFYKLTFPLKQLAGVKPVRTTEAATMSVSVAPNPASGYTDATVELPKQGYMIVALYDALGRQIKKIAADLFDRGVHNLRVDTHDVGDGTYYLRIESSAGVATTKVVVRN